MWFIGSFALVTFMVLLSWLLGQAILTAAGFRMPIWKPERAALGTVLGAAVLILASGWLSWLGFPMRGNGIILTADLVLLAVITLAWRWHRSSPVKRPSPNGRRLLPLMALSALVGFVLYLSLFSLLRDNAFDPYNDVISYISLGEYLQDHSFRVPIPVQVQSPVVAMPFMYQLRGWRMGANFFLALVQSWVPFSRSIDVYPAVSAFAVILDLLTVFLCGRWLVRMPVFYSLCGCLFGFTNLCQAYYVADLGMMNQLYGVAFFFTGLALAGRLYSAAPGGGRSWVVLLGLVSAALVSAYPEMLPMYGLSLIGAFGLRAIATRCWGWRRLVNLLLAGGLTAFLSNIEFLRAMKSVPFQMRLGGGWHIPYTPWQVIASWLGVFPGYNEWGFYSDFVGNGFLYWVQYILAWLIIALVAYSVAMLAARLQFFRFAEFSCAFTVYLGLTVYFAFFVMNPNLPGHLGQTWSISKLTIYSFPLGVCAFTLAFRRMPYGRPLVFSIALLSALSFWPIHDGLAHRRTAQVRSLTGNASDPFGAFTQFSAMVRNEADGRAVQLIIPVGALCHHYELAAYYLFPLPVASEQWKTAGCVYLGQYEGTGYLNPPAPHAFTLGSIQDQTAQGSPIPAGFLLRHDSSLPIATLTHGWTSLARSSGSWGNWSEGAGEIAIRLKRSETVELRGELECPLPNHGVAVRLDGRTIVENGCGPSGFTHVFEGLASGDHTLKFDAVPSENKEPAGRFFLHHFHIGDPPPTPPPA